MKYSNEDQKTIDTTVELLKELTDELVEYVYFTQFKVLKSKGTLKTRVLDLYYDKLLDNIHRTMDDVDMYIKNSDLTIGLRSDNEQ